MNSRWRPGPLGRHGGAVVSDIAPNCSLVRIDTSPLPPPSMQCPGTTAADLRHGGVQGRAVDEQAESEWHPGLPAPHRAGEEFALDPEQQILGFGAEHRRQGHAGGAFGQNVSQAVGEIAAASDGA